MAKKKPKYDRSQFVMDQTPYELEDWIILESDPRFDNALGVLQNSSEIALDIETFGNNTLEEGLYPETGDIRLIQVYLPETDQCIIWDLGEQDKRVPGATSEVYGWNQILGIRVLLERLISTECTVTIHNAAFESRWFLSKFGFPILNIQDTMLISQVIWAGLGRGFASAGISKMHTLQNVSIRLGFAVLDKENQVYDYAMPTTNRQLNYGANDAKRCYEVAKALYEYYVKPEKLHYTVEAELRAIPGFAMMEYRGFPIDPIALESILCEYKVVLGDLIKPFLEAFPDVNPASPLQLKKALSEYLGVELESTDASSLAPYTKDPLIDALSTYKSITTGSKYLEGLLESVKVREGFEVVCGNFKQMAEQGTGRSSCTKPSLQIVPNLAPSWKHLGLRSIRDAFKAPKGYKLIVLDIAGCHAQIARYASQDPKLIEANESSLKVHFYTISGMLALQGIEMSPLECKVAYKDENHSFHQKVKELYPLSKTNFYGGLNLNGGATLQRTFLNNDPPLELPLEDCKNYVKAFQETYRDLRNYQIQLISEANSNTTKISVKEYEGAKKPLAGTIKGIYGIARSLCGGRIHLEKSPSQYNPKVWTVQGTEAVAFHWQRLEATCIKNALGDITAWMYKKYDFEDTWIANFAHDELDIIVKEEIALEVSEFAFKTLNQRLREWISDYQPDETDASKFICDCWSEK